MIEMEHGYYVYGIVAGDDSPAMEGPVAGIDPAYPLYTLSHQAIQAVVSKVSLREFGREALEARANDTEWLIAKACAHENILETVSAARALIPMRFCNIYNSEGRVREMLAQYYDDFVTNLARLEGKREWGIKIYCDESRLADGIERISDRVKELKAEMATKSSGAAYILRKKLDAATSEEIERASNECAQRSHDRLSSHAAQSTLTALRDRQLTGRRDEMILNGAYLVVEGQLAVFRGELERLQGDYGDLGFSFEMTGPWPPYNFVTIGSGDVA